MRSSRIVSASLVGALLCVPAVALAQFTSTEQIGWPSMGVFPAYPNDRLDRTVEYSVSGGVTRDSNVFRISDSAAARAAATALLGTSERSDTITRGGLGMRVNLPDRKSTRLNSSHIQKSRMPSSA